MSEPKSRDFFDGDYQEFLDSNQGSVIVFETESASPHFETGLEIALRFASSGWKTRFVYLGDSLFEAGSGWESYPYWLTGRKKSFTWPDFSLRRIRRNYWLMAKAQAFASQNNWSFSTRRLPSDNLRPENEQLPHFESLEALKNWSQDGFPVGKYLASSAVSFSKNSRFNVRDSSGFLDVLYTAFRRSKIIADRELSDTKYDFGVLFNGRFAESGGVLASLQAAGITPIFHEKGGDPSTQYFVGFCRPHDQLAMGKNFAHRWATIDGKTMSKKKASVASQLEEARRQGGLGPVTFHWNSSVSEQSVSEKYDVVYFPTSDDELDSVSDVDPGYDFPGQQQALLAISDACADLGLSFAVRVHPHTEKKHSDDHSWWNEKVPELLPRDRVVRSYEAISSYGLVDNAKVVITLGSTITLEAIWAGKPTIVLCHTLYEYAGAEVIRTRNRPLTKVIKEAIGTVPRQDSILPSLNGSKDFGEEFFFLQPFTRKAFDTQEPFLWQLDAFLRKVWRRVFAVLLLPSKRN